MVKTSHQLLLLGQQLPSSSPATAASGTDDRLANDRMASVTRALRTSLSSSQTLPKESMSPCTPPASLVPAVYARAPLLDSSLHANEKFICPVDKPTPEWMSPVSPATPIAHSTDTGATGSLGVAFPSRSWSRSPTPIARGSLCREWRKLSRRMQLSRRMRWERGETITPSPERVRR